MRHLVVYLCLMIAACATTTRGEKTDREQLRVQSLGMPLQGQLSDGRIRYCLRMEGSDDESDFQAELDMKLGSMVLLKKCGVQIYMHSRTIQPDTSTIGSVQGMVPSYEQVHEWQCATVDPRQVSVHCTNPQPTEEPPQTPRIAPPPTKSGDASEAPHKRTLVYPGNKTPNPLDTVSSTPDEVETTESPNEGFRKLLDKEMEIRLRCQSDETSLLKTHLADRDQLIQEHSDRVTRARSTMVGTVLDRELRGAKLNLEWGLNEALTRYKWASNELRVRCRWKLHSGE